MKTFVTIRICIVLLLPRIAELKSKNNACRSYLSYLNIAHSEECYYIPDAGQDVPEIINRHIGSCETHQVTTEDGYILTIFRIPRKEPKGVILLQHPLTVDSKIWLSQYNQSTAFIFWKAGYDVWLGNSRGTLYSKKHVNLSHTEKKFWDYSFHEMGLYDLKSSVDYIKNISNVSKIIYLGHSMSTTSALVYASMRPREASNSVKVIINMGTAAFLRHITSPTALLAPLYPLIQYFSGMLDNYSVLAHDAPYLKLGRAILQNLPFKKWLVKIIAYFYGGTFHEYDPQYINLMVAQFGSEVSWKTFYHYAQIVLARGNFNMYDYGKERNVELYGQEKAPHYPIENIVTPVYLVYSTDDKIATAKDNEMLFGKLPVLAKIYGKVKIQGLNHLDYHYGKSRIIKVYSKVLEFLDAIR